MDQEEIKKSIQERFNNLQPEIQEAIMSSNYEKELFEIGKKYELNIEQMGNLELNTTLVLLGQTHPDQYFNELSDDLKLPPKTINAIVDDVNERIMKNIRDLLKQNFDNDDEEEAAFIEMPLPPAVDIKKIEESKKEEDLVPTPISKKTTQIDTPSNEIVQKEKTEDVNHPIYKEAGIEILNEDKKSEVTEKTDFKKDSALLESGMNMMRDKLDGITVSKSKVSDYSLPKINNAREQKQFQSVPISTNSKDPYHKDPYQENIE